MRRPRDGVVRACCAACTEGGWRGSGEYLATSPWQPAIVAMPAEQPPNGVDSACQLELFDGTLAEPQRAGTEPLASTDRRDGSNADWEVPPTTLAESSTASGRRTYSDADRAVLKALEVVLADAR